MQARALPSRVLHEPKVCEAFIDFVASVCGEYLASMYTWAYAFQLDATY